MGVNDKRRDRNKIPDNITNNIQLNETIEKCLPANYNFEIHKTIARIRTLNAKRVALQLPDGLHLFAFALADILSKFAYADETLDILIMGDVTYGACCIDDYTSRALGCDLLIHYGHSCLVPLDCSKTFYVFVYINIDTKHFIDSVFANFDEGTHMVFISTIQYNSTLQAVAEELAKKFKITIPKSAPLSFGEVLGCTAPTVADVDCILFLGDGRFHLEAMMLANPSLPAFAYSPFTKVITREKYDHKVMQTNRWRAIETAKTAKTFGIIKGTLGRQGSSKVLDNLIDSIESLSLNYVVILLSEISPQKLELFGDSIDAFIQIACPRLSIDWAATSFKKPLLTPYEASVALNMAKWMPHGHYPMDFYAHDSLGSWTPNHDPVKLNRKKHIVVGEKNLPVVLQQIQLETKPATHCKEHEWENCTNCTCMNH